jgi:hypothetical protein
MNRNSVLVLWAFGVATAAAATLVGSAVAVEPFASPHSETSVFILESPVGVRNVGMGVTGVSDFNQPSSDFFNPATLAWADAAWLSFSYEDLFLDISKTDTRLVLGHRWGDESSRDKWRLGGAVGYTSVDYHNVPVRTVFRPEGTGEFLTHDYYIVSALALAWERGNEAIAAGVSGKYLDLQFSDSWLLDYGFVATTTFMLDGSMLRPRAGFAQTNFDSGLGDSTQYDVAEQTRFGLGLDFATSPTARWGRDVSAAGASLNVDYTDRGRYDSLWSIGFEMSVLELLQLRAGYEWYEDDYNEVAFGLGVGWEFGRWAVHADYAHTVLMPSYLDLDTDRDLFGATLGAHF